MKRNDKRAVADLYGVKPAKALRNLGNGRRSADEITLEADAQHVVKPERGVPCAPAQRIGIHNSSALGGRPSAFSLSAVVAEIVSAGIDGGAGEGWPGIAPHMSAMGERLGAPPPGPAPKPAIAPGDGPCVKVGSASGAIAAGADAGGAGGGSATASFNCASQLLRVCRSTAQAANAPAGCAA